MRNATFIKKVEFVLQKEHFQGVIIPHWNEVFIDCILSLLILLNLVVDQTVK
jgi:hypothetical protein